MASSSARPERVYHQDYIARIRYSNTLPPPPNPPKLLDIPNTGLASGLYTSAGFASRLAREQPLNIEADAELGMPIDLVGLPGVFDGDESAIQAAQHPPPLHPHDRPLLRPLATLGKPASITSGVSFLRRTEYITAQSGSPLGAASKDLLRSRTPAKKRRKPDVAKDDPIHILRSIIKGFDVAYPRDAYTGPDSGNNIRGAEVTQAERDAWANPRHSTKSDVRLLDSYPVLPDLNAFPETGAYMVVKFITNPVPSTEKYDERLDVSLLRPLDPADKLLVDPEAPQSALPLYDYEFFLPESSDSVTGIKRKFSVLDPDNDSPDLYDPPEGAAQAGERCFKYQRVRAYETYQQTGDGQNVHGDTVAVALHDAEADVVVAPGLKQRLQKAAYYYPIIQRTFIRPRRAANARMLAQMASQEDDKVDVIQARVRDMNDQEAAKVAGIRDRYDTAVGAEA